MIDNIDENPWWGHSEVHCGHYHQQFIMFLMIRMIINIQFTTKHFSPITKGMMPVWELGPIEWVCVRINQRAKTSRTSMMKRDIIILMRRTGLFWWGEQDYFYEEDRIICRIYKIAETLPVLFCWQSLVFQRCCCYYIFLAHSGYCNKNYVWS